MLVYDDKSEEHVKLEAHSYNSVYLEIKLNDRNS